MGRSSLCIWMIAFLVWAAGCTWTFRSEEQDLQWPLSAPNGKGRIGLVVGKEVYLNGQRRPEAETLLTLTAAQADALEAYTSSGLFESVHIGLNEKALTAEIHISIQSQENRIWTAICVFTFWVVPCRSTQDVVVRTTIRDEHYQVVSMVEKRGEQTVWTGWIVLAAMPIRVFYHPPDLIYDLVRLGIDTAHVKRWL